MNHEQRIAELEAEIKHLKECIRELAGSRQDYKERLYAKVRDGKSYWTPEEQNSINRFWEKLADEGTDINEFISDLTHLGAEEEDNG